MYDRYSDLSKFIADIDKLQMNEDSYVYISEYHDIAISLEDCPESFEKQKSLIICLEKQICELDNMVQRFHDSKKQRENLVALPSS